MSTEEQLQRAKDLIKAKRYDDARKLLWKIDHPKAKQWLERIDGITNNAAPVQQKTASRYNCSRTALLIIMIPFGLLAIFGGFLIANNLINGEAYEARSRLLSYCLDVYREVSQRSGVEECFEWYPLQFDLYRDEVIACHRLSPVLDEPFSDCLIDEDILPYGFTAR